MMGAMTQLTVNVGILVSFLLGLNVAKTSTIRAHPDEEWWWRFMFAFPILTAALRSVCLLTVFRFETPSFLISTGKDEEARKLIDKIYFQEHSEEIYKDVKTRMSNYKDVTYGELFGKKYRTRLGMGILLSFIQQFSGVNAVLFYSDKILKGDVSDPDKVDPFDDKMAKIFTILIGCILIFASWLSGKFIDKFGRKSILLLGELCCIVTLLLLAIFGFLGLDNPSKYIILLFMFSFGISLGPIVWLYLPEILPEKGVSLAALANWVGCGIIGLFFPMVKDAIKIQGTFLIFLGCCVAALIYMFFCVKETKGKSSEEIEAMFGGENLKDEEKTLISGNTSAPY
jgi:MFS family permease